MIQIAKTVCQKDSNIYFLFCGKGVLEGMKSKIDDFNLNDKIIAPGVCTNIPAHHSIMDMFLFPSLNEGQPNALLEAMIAGLPVLASNIPPIVETVPRELKPLLITPWDISTFVEAIDEMKSGTFAYDLKSIQTWAKNKYNPKVRFNEFYMELKINE